MLHVTVLGLFDYINLISCNRNDPVAGKGLLLVPGEGEGPFAGLNIVVVRLELHPVALVGVQLHEQLLMGDDVMLRRVIQPQLRFAQPGRGLDLPVDDPAVPDAAEGTAAGMALPAFLIGFLLIHAASSDLTDRAFADILFLRCNPGPVAQLDRVADFESVGRGFEPLLAHPAGSLRGPAFIIAGNPPGNNGLILFFLSAGSGQKPDG